MSLVKVFIAKWVPVVIFGRSVAAKPAVMRVFGNDIGWAGIAKFRLYKEKFERETGYAFELGE